MPNKNPNDIQLTDEEKAIYEWQMTVPNFGEEGQKKLKSATALVSRCGGLGGPLAYNLACAGFGKVIIAHGGRVKYGDLNRQILVTRDWLGKSRIESIQRRLLELNPRLKVEGIPENIHEKNVEDLVSKADVVFSCAPLFTERFLMNRECVRQNKPLIDASMFSMEGQIITILPGKTACLACLYPEMPPAWQRQFPVFAAVSAIAAGIAAVEGIKLLVGFGKLLAGTLLYYDSLHMNFQRIPMERRPDCDVCGNDSIHTRNIN